jgi:hypothetical protein
VGVHRIAAKEIPQDRSAIDTGDVTATGRGPCDFGRLASSQFDSWFSHVRPRLGGFTRVSYGKAR